MLFVSRHPTVRSVVWNTGSQVIGKAISSIAGLIVTLIVAGTYGANGYGDFVKITTFLSFFYLLSDFGINAIALKKWEKSSDSPTTSIYETLVALRIVISVVLVVVANICMLVLPTGVDQGYTWFVKIGIVLLSPAILYQGMITTANAYFQRILRYDLATKGLLIGSIISVPLLWVASKAVPTATGVIIATSIVGLSYFITAAYSMHTAIGKNGKFHIMFSQDRMKMLFLTSLPFGLTLIFNTLYFRVDSVILTLYRSTEEVGIYGYVYKFFEVPLVIPTFFMNAVYPLLLSATPEKFNRLVKKSFVILLIVSILVTATLWTCAPFLSLVRNEFAAGIKLYRVLVLGMPFFFISSLLMWMLVARGRQKALMVIYGISMMGAVICNFLFIPDYGAIAAAWITMVGEFFVVLLLAIAIFFTKSK